MCWCFSRFWYVSSCYVFSLRESKKGLWVWSFLVSIPRVCAAFKVRTFVTVWADVEPLVFCAVVYTFGVGKLRLRVPIEALPTFHCSPLLSEILRNIMKNPTRIHTPAKYSTSRSTKSIILYHLLPIYSAWYLHSFHECRTVWISLGI